jgi:phosphoglycolate phosphatase
VATPGRSHPPVLLFDLDGTLVDSVAGICASAAAACRALGYACPDEALFQPLIGLPLPRMLRAGLPVDVDDGLVERCCEAYRGVFDRIARPTTAPFPGVVVSLDRWRAQGRRLGLATSKRSDVAERVLEWSGLSGRFEVVVGGDQVPRGKPHPDTVERALALLGAEPGQAAMVGDTTHDVLMALAADVAPYGVGHGVHARAELEAAGALAVVDRFEELADYLG